MDYFPDDVSQITDNHPDYIPAPPNRRARLTVLLHKRLNQIIDQEHQPRLTRQKRERLAGLHRQVKADIASNRYGAREGEVRDLGRKYKIGR